MSCRQSGEGIQRGSADHVKGAGTLPDRNSKTEKGIRYSESLFTLGYVVRSLIDKTI
jgi:hypothetical protein